MDDKDNKSPKTTPVKPAAKPRNPFNQFVPATKTALRVNTTPNSKQEIQRRAAERVPSNRPILVDGTPDNSPSKPPLSVITPNKSKLQRVLQFDNDTAVYANVVVDRFELTGCKLQQALAIIISQTEMLKGKITGLAVHPEESKHMAASLTPENREKVELHRKITKQRYPSQQQAVANEETSKVSATTVFDYYFNKNMINEFVEQMHFLTDEEKNAFLGQLKNFSAEWLHLIDHANLGDEAQTAVNLVFGSRPANLQMMVSESYERECLLLDRQLIDVAVEAKMIKDTQFAYSVTLTIQHPDKGNYKTNIEFNPFTTQRPVVGTIEYFKIVQHALRKRAYEKTEPSTSFWDTKPKQDLDEAPKKNKIDDKDQPGKDMDAESTEALLPKKLNN